MVTIDCNELIAETRSIALITAKLSVMRVNPIPVADLSQNITKHLRNVQTPWLYELRVQQANGKTKQVAMG